MLQMCSFSPKVIMICALPVSEEQMGGGGLGPPQLKIQWSGKHTGDIWSLRKGWRGTGVSDHGEDEKGGLRGTYKAVSSGFHKG